VPDKVNGFHFLKIRNSFYYIFAAMTKAKRVRRYIQYGFVYWLVRLLIRLSMSMPRKTWLKLCGALGGLAYHLAAETRKLTIRHLSMAFPTKSTAEIKSLAKSTFRMLGKNGGDILRSSRSIRSLSDLEQVLITEGLENYEVANKKGKGVIFLTCHLGAFDMQITNMAMRGLNPHIIGTPLKDKRLNALLWDYRNAHGAIPIARGKETFKLIKVLKSAGSVALLIDQDTKVKSVFVEFFGKKASTPATYIHLGEDGMQHMHILPEIPMTISGDEEKDIVFNTQILTNFIEETIRKYPDQWVWMHERWKTQ
jgi:Kdo2-lipid IVA lauroyltransferase/acyltransferase